ncbi:MAG: hypothetical protein Q4C70_00485 [Planctomycetia bacterium]|nr:hypothetical protein [Planctomycetia bacterium]
MTRFIYLLFTCLTATIFLFLPCTTEAQETRGNHTVTPSATTSYTDTPSATTSSARVSEIPTCSVCEKSCNRGHIRVRDEIFCSETCLATKYSCASCGQTLGTRACPSFSTITDIEEKSVFFCPNCMEKSGCVFCGSRLETSQLPDKRIICSTCKKTAIFKTEDALPILQNAQKMLHERYGFPIKPNIPLAVVSQTEFHRRATGTKLTTNALALHLTHFQGKTQLSDDGKTLFVEMDELDSGMIVLEGSPAALAFDSIVHELTHEFLCRKFYHFDDPKIEEGFCESIAAACSIYNGHPHLATRRITNQDPIYGDGFRLMYTMLQDKGWDETMKFLKENSQSMRDYIRNNLTEVLDSATIEHIKKNNLKPKLKFGKIR